LESTPSSDLFFAEAKESRLIVDKISMDFMIISNTPNEAAGGG
jgi:hypothetical protein